MRVAHCTECGYESARLDPTNEHCPRCGGELHFLIRLDPVSEETRKTRILVVDDSAQVLDVVVDYLNAMGFEHVRRAASGPDAAVVAEEFQPDVVLLDYLMPALKGDDTARLLRKLIPNAKVVAFSAVLHERPEWADAFLPKSKLSEAALLIESLLPVTAEH